MQGKDTSNHYQSNTALPYVSNGSPTDKESIFQSGSSNILTSIRNYFEKRNGFAFFVSPSSWTFSGTVKRFFTWNRWSGASVTLSNSYFVMYNDVSATASRVYKQRYLSGSAVDTNPVLIHTDASSANPFDFVVANDYVYFGNGVDMKKWDGTTVTNWGITGPTSPVTITTTGGTLNPVTGFQYVICWDSSASGEISSPSPPSASTGPQTSTNFIISGNTTSDTQVDRVRFFRTVDGGSIYFEHPSSPIPIATWTVSGFTDSTGDYSVTAINGIGAPGAEVAPLPNQNNRPTPSYSATWFANRVWTAINDTIYYSDYEELVRGVEESAFDATNQRAFGKEVIRIAASGAFLLIYTQDVIFRIYGDSLATFRMDTLATKKGAQNRAAVVSFSYKNFEGVAWLDSSNTVWITDGTKEGMLEISEPIRPDIASIDHSQAAMAYYENANAHWLILMDGGAGKLRVFDLDNARWMPPWSISTITAIHAGQINAASWKLWLAQSGKPLAQDANYQDAGVSIGMTSISNLFDLVPANNPSMYGVADHIAVESSASGQPSTVKYMTDDDPTTGTYVTATQVNDPPNRQQGTNIVEKWYQILTETRAARRMSVRMDWNEANSNAKVYGVNLGYEPKA